MGIGDLKERARHVETSDPDSLGVEAKGVDFLPCEEDLYRGIRHS